MREGSHIGQIQSDIQIQTEQMNKVMDDILNSFDCE
jgi:hypothetical protein